MKRSFEPNVIPNVALNQDYPNVTMDVSKINIPAHVALNQDYPNVTKNFEPRLSKRCQEL
jgi:hypothetical protein